MLHPGHSLKPGDFVELLEGIFELNEELVPVLAVELGDYPTPDPTWDYAIHSFNMSDRPNKKP